MKSIVQFGIAVVVMALAPLGTANAVSAVLFLKPFVRVAKEDVQLGDIAVTKSAGSFPADLIVCKSPDPGTIKILTKDEVSAVLNRAGAGYRLQGSPKIQIVRIGRQLSETDLKPVVDATLLMKGSRISVSSLQLQAAIMVAKDAEIKLVKLKFDSTIQKYRLWFCAVQGKRKVFFEATGVVDSEAVPLEIDFSQKTARLDAKTVIVQRGQLVRMEIDGKGFSAALPVFCMEQGRQDQIVRVRDAVAKRMYRAQVVDKGSVREISQEN